MMYGIKDRRNSPLPPLGLLASHTNSLPSPIPSSNMQRHPRSLDDYSGPQPTLPFLQNPSLHSPPVPSNSNALSSDSAPSAHAGGASHGSINGISNHYTHTPTHTGWSNHSSHNSASYALNSGPPTTTSSTTLPSQAQTSPASSIPSTQPTTTSSSLTPTPSSAPASAADPFHRPSSTTGYFSAPPSQQPTFSSSAPHQSAYSPYHHHHHHQPSPTTHSPTSANGAGRHLHAVPGAPHQQPPSGMAPPSNFNRYPYPMPIVPPMGGPIMSNLSNPNGHMSMMSGMGMPGYGHNMMPPMYGHPQNPQTERPFKCDQCPVAFNRNHDLKRHKRIHLSVKPFPCDFCDKSFSRKDALKV